MSETTRAIWEWQQRLKAQPKVYWTRYSDLEPTGNFYDSRESAQKEVDYYGGRLVIMETPLHNLELSRERWSR